MKAQPSTSGFRGLVSKDVPLALAQRFPLGQSLPGDMEGGL